MLLIDGVRYEEWKISNEDELEKMVVEHAQDIFSENSIYFDKKQKLRSMAGVGTIPDGLAIILSENPQWHIVEVELSSHDPYEHIVPQVDKFINATENTNSRNKIVEALYEEIDNDNLTKLKIKQFIGQNKDIHKFLSDLIMKTPFITIVIEKDTSQLREALKKYAQKKVIEFQTFKREDAETVHVHLFEPLYKPAISTKLELYQKSLPTNSFNINIYKSYMDFDYIGVWAKWKHLFPSSTTKVKLETDMGIIENEFRVGDWGQGFVGGIKKWFKAHPELKPSDKLRITVIEPMKKYRLDIVKS